MGNRAVITNKRKKIGIYLHWNGGRDSVNAFLTYAKLMGVRGCDNDETYCFARLTQIIANFFGGTTSVGVGIYDELDRDNYDNGVYIIDNDFNIVGREFFNDTEEQNEYELFSFILYIDNRMPTQLDNETIANYFKKTIAEVKQERAEQQ